MIQRIQEKIKNRIPFSQAAYRVGRSTTEHVLTCKILAEKQEHQNVMKQQYCYWT